MLGYDGLATDGKRVFFTQGPEWRLNRNNYGLEKPGAVWIKLKNFRKDISFFYGYDGKTWIKLPDAIRSHDSYRIALFSSGAGKATFRDFQYQGLE